MKLEDFYTKERHDEGAEVRLKDEAGKLTGCYLRVAGLDSEAYREAKAKLERAALMASMVETDDKPSTSLLRAECLADCVIDGRGFDGDVDKERMIKLFIMAPYVADQVDSFISKRANFMRPSAKK